MKKKQSTLSKFDWAALTALLFVLVYEAPSERIFLSVIIFASYWVSEWFWRASHRKIAPAFHLPAILVIALTVAEASKMLCPWLENMEVAFIAVPVIWLSLSSPRLDQRLESSCIFLIFSFLLAAVQTLTHFAFEAFYPLRFIIIAFASVLLSTFFSLTRRRTN